MANRDFKCTFKDGSEYEVRLYHLGGIKIRDEFGAVLFDNGLYVSQDIAEILDRFKDELKATDRMYDNPMESIEEVERMPDEFTVIMGYPCKFHSLYKGWEIYRAWDIVNDHGRMMYFAANVAGASGLTILQAENLSGIKKRVSVVERMELDQGEIMKALNDGAGEFMDLELFSDWSEEEKENTRTFLVEFYNVWAVTAIMKAAIVKLDRMADEEVEE